MPTDAEIQRLAARTAAQRDFTGHTVVTHTIERGQTLSAIARIYLRKSWRPIWIYNSRVEHTISSQDEISRGGVIFIPRTKEGYKLLISRLENVQDQVEVSALGLTSQLEGLLYELKARKVLFDFGSDVASAVLTLGILGARAAKLARVAEQTAGQAKIAARLSARSATRDLAEKYATARSRLLKPALEANSKLVKATETLGETQKGRLTDGAVKVADSLVNKVVGRDEGDSVKNIRNVIKGTLIIREVMRGTATVVHSMKSVFDIILDNATPSTVAELALHLLTGESAEGSIDTQMEMIKRNTERMMQDLDERIDAIGEECSLLYG